jgi:hypothetical protein
MALTDNLTHYWKFDESSGNAADSVGSLTLTNVSNTYGTGKINNGLITNAPTSTSTLASAAVTLGLSTAYSWSVWVKCTGTGNFQIMNKDNPGASKRDYQIKIDNGKAGFIRFNTSNSVITNITGATSVNDGNWHHIVYVFNGAAGSRIYVDGNTTPDASDSVTTNNNNSDAVTGMYFASAMSTASIDEMGFWTKALSTAEITSLYNSGNGIQYPFPVGPNNLKSYNTNLKANIKSINGNLLANCKSLNGNM